MKTEITSWYSCPGGRLDMEKWQDWVSHGEERNERCGHYISASGHHVRVWQHAYGSNYATTLDMYIGSRGYRLRRERLYTDHGLKMLAARFVKDVLELKK